MKMISDAVRKTYPDAVCAHTGAPFTRPDWTGDTQVYVSGFYWENHDGDRFYFPTFEEAAEDIALDMGMSEAEAKSICDAS